MSDRLAKLQAERAALEAEIRAESASKTRHRGRGRAALYAAIGCNPRSAARSGYVARATCTVCFVTSGIEAGRQRLTIDTLMTFADAAIQAVSLIHETRIISRNPHCATAARSAQCCHGGCDVWCERAAYHRLRFGLNIA